MFIDEVKIKVIAGKGGDGLVSWRREKYIPKGGPRGGDAGHGGNIILQTDNNLNTLSEYRHKKVLQAEKGEGGGTQLCHGANGEDLILKIPVGTIVRDANTEEILADLDENNTRLLIAKGGKGGFGNAHFCSSTRQAPAFAEIGDISEEKDLLLELKLVADIGIIGVPSAGKSTLIGNITNVKPKIGDYPFTTLTPNLGVLDHKGKSLVLEDVPGLIPGASQGKGLGIEFLKHIERTGVLLHLLDMYRMDKVFSDYEDIRKELEYFSEDLAKKEEIVVFSKADLLDDEMKDYIVSEFKKKHNKEVFVISAATGEGIDDLVDFLIDSYSREKIIEQLGENEDDELKIYNLKNTTDPKKVTLRYLGDLVFEAKGERLEQIVRMSDFTNGEAVMRVYDVLEKLMVMKDLEQQLAQKLEKEDLDNSFFFEGSEEKEIKPKIVIAGKEIPLDRLKYKI
ncbi:GTPase ObgE [Candidatus Gracilibacteria bacterium 28_42_T64]|nr:GTPase ObgE [Candidatus Gracilibacteria bacterium 28_42_T64]